jgi:hypothetical protein
MLDIYRLIDVDWAEDLQVGMCLTYLEEKLVRWEKYSL